MKNSLRALALAGALSIASWVQADTMTSNGRPTPAHPIATSAPSLKWRTDVFYGAEDFDVLLNCLPPQQAATAKVSSQVFTNPWTREVETYHLITFLDIPKEEYTQTICQQLLENGCSVLCPKE